MGGPARKSHPMTDLITSPSQEERQWAALAHIAALAGLIVPLVGAIAGPLVVWLIKKDNLPFVADQAREALNFQVTVCIAAAIAFLLIFVRVGVVLLFLLFVADLVLIWIATFKANEGIAYRYPLNLRLIKG
jgi:uncharacterized protein